jgi:hypothetical protein
MADETYLIIEHLSIKDIVRIFRQIDVDAATGCWNWNGSLRNGYGRVFVHGHEQYAHRVMFAWLVCPLPKGNGKHIPLIDHIVCDNRRCCNPAHLILTTPQKNISRAALKQTHCRHGRPLPDKPNRSDGSRRCNVCKCDYARRVRNSPKNEEIKAKKREWGKRTGYWHSEEYRQLHNARIKARQNES